LPHTWNRKKHEYQQDIDRFKPVNCSILRSIPLSVDREIYVSQGEDEMTHAKILMAASAAFVLLGTASANADQSGVASVYSYGRTASGERVHAGAMTAAHRSLPFGTRVRVTNRHTGRSVVVRINDRGPFVRGRVIDMTPAAAHAIGFSGLAPVSLTVIGRG
jgi:rare lipoprotein A